MTCGGWRLAASAQRAGGAQQVWGVQTTSWQQDPQWRWVSGSAARAPSGGTRVTLHVFSFLSSESGALNWLAPKSLSVFLGTLDLQGLL